MRRRRRSQGAWLPTIGTAITGVGPDPEQVLAGRRFTITLASQVLHTIIFPLTYDVPQYKDANLTTDKGLGEIVGNEYVVKRIVGKLFAFRQPVLDEGVEVGSPVLLTVGFFVARAGDGEVLQDQPIGASAQLRDVYNPLDMDNIREPWMWRRTWVLGNPGSVHGGGLTFQSESEGMLSFPSSTVGYGSVLDGPHFDVKSKRRVSQEDRLWCAVGAAGLAEITETITVPHAIHGYIDYRIFGQLRRPRARGNF